MEFTIPHSRPTLGEAEARAASDAVLSGFVGSGSRVADFENGVAVSAGRTHGLATSSGSAALHLSLLAAGVRAGDEVVIPAFVCRAVLNAVRNAGAVPVLADIDSADLTVSTAEVERRITARTRAIVGVHMFGAPADMNALQEIVTAHSDIVLIEDAASSVGATLGGRPIGSFGAMSVFSFASTKMMTTGQGGMICTDRAALVSKVRDLMDYDCNSAAKDGTAFNYQMTDVQGAIGLVQLRRVGLFVKKRTEIAKQYSAALSGDRVRALSARPNSESSHYRFIVDAGEEAVAMREFLQSSGVDARNAVAHHLYDYMHVEATQYPVAESMRRRLVSLPIYPSLSSGQVDEVCDLLRSFVSR